MLGILMKMLKMSKTPNVHEMVEKWDVLKILLNFRKYQGKHRKKMAYELVHAAILAGRNDIVDTFVDEISTHVKCGDTLSLWMKALYKHNFEAAQILLKHKKVNVHVRDFQERTLLHHAAYTTPDIVRLLIEQDCEIDAVNDRGETPLHLAALEGNESIVSCLIEYGADVNAATSLRNTPLHYAVIRGHASVVQILIKAGAEIEARDVNQETPLIAAVDNGCIDCVNLLLQAGANINARDGWQRTSVHRAITHNNLEMLKILVKNGADLYAPIIDNACALHVWGQHGLSNDESLKILDFLLEAGFDIDAKDDYGCTPLHYAAHADNAYGVKELIKRGANKNVQNVNGDTPLHAALCHNNWNAAEILLQHKAKTDIANKKGITPKQLMQQKTR